MLSAVVDASSWQVQCKFLSFWNCVTLGVILYGSWLSLHWTHNMNVFVPRCVNLATTKRPVGLQLSKILICLRSVLFALPLAFIKLCAYSREHKGPLPVLINLKIWFIQFTCCGKNEGTSGRTNLTEVKKLSNKCRSFVILSVWRQTWQYYAYRLHFAVKIRKWIRLMSLCTFQGFRPLCIVCLCQCLLVCMIDWFQLEPSDWYGCTCTYVKIYKCGMNRFFFPLVIQVYIMSGRKQ